MNRENFNDCYAELNEGLLVVGNSLIERKWLIQEEGIFAISLYDKLTEVEWLKNKTKHEDGALSTFIKTSLGIECKGLKPISLNCCSDNDFDVGASHYKITVILRNAVCDIKWELRIYPEMPVIRSMYYIKANVKIDTPVSQCTEKKMFEAAFSDIIDFLPLKEGHCKWKSVGFRAFSDTNNNLVSEDHGLLYRNENRWLQGNMLFLKQTFSKNGLLIVKESPNAREHANYPGGDFFMRGNDILITGSGIGKSELDAEDFIPAFGSAVCLWNDIKYNESNICNAYHEACHKFDPSKDCTILCNTWGDRSKGDKLSDAFIIAELEAAKKIGITIYQIDEGWQENAEQPYGYNYTWNINREKFPNEFYTIKEKANALGIKLGLWFRPYTPDDYAAWEADADKLINFYERFGITSFKLDGFRILSLIADLNFAKMLQKVIKASNNKVNFNIDITNEKRVGFLRHTQYGNLFLENRYSEWSNYYPHFTLRNLWLLSKYYPSYKLQMEFLNTDRNIDKYEGDPLAPHVCGMEYAFAVTMFSNPLAWFEPSCLSDENTNKLKELISVYKKYQQDILSGQVLPIGEEPDGVSWTGFQSICGKGKGYLLIIREKNENPIHSFKLWSCEDKKAVNLKILLGSGSSQQQAIGVDGKLTLKHTEPLSFGLYSYELC